MMNGCWHLTGVRDTEAMELRWDLMYMDLQPVSHCAVFIRIQTTPPPKVRNRPHAFRLLEEYRRARLLPWLEEVRVDAEGWCKCVLDLERLSAFLEPLLDDPIVHLAEEGSAPTVSESELTALLGTVTVPCGVGFSGSDGASYLDLAIPILQNQLEPTMPIAWTKIERQVRALKEDSPRGRRRAFLMMSFATTPVHEEIAAAVRDTLGEHDIVTLRADEHEYHDDLLLNVLTYVHGCDFGVAVFERLASAEFNPNVAFELGYMMALGKPVCLLKDASLPTLAADLSGKLYRRFDPDDIPASVGAALGARLRARRLS